MAVLGVFPTYVLISIPNDLSESVPCNALGVFGSVELRVSDLQTHLNLHRPV